jgi:hypothetical protein
MNYFNQASHLHCYALNDVMLVSLLASFSCVCSLTMLPIRNHAMTLVVYCVILYPIYNCLPKRKIMEDAKACDIKKPCDILDLMQKTWFF